MTHLAIFAVFWGVLGTAGFVTGNDAIFITGLVSSGVYSVGLKLLIEIKKKESN